MADFVRSFWLVCQTKGPFGSKDSGDGRLVTLRITGTRRHLAQGILAGGHGDRRTGRLGSHAGASLTTTGRGGLPFADSMVDSEVAPVALRITTD
jgi:hypothetical protein